MGKEGRKVTFFDYLSQNQAAAWLIGALLVALALAVVRWIERNP